MAWIEVGALVGNWGCFSSLGLDAAEGSFDRARRERRAVVCRGGSALKR